MVKAGLIYRKNNNNSSSDAIRSHKASKLLSARGAAQQQATIGSAGDTLQKIYYSFSSVVQSMNAKVYYLSRENFESFFKFVETGVAEKVLNLRMGLIKD